MDGVHSHHDHFHRIQGQPLRGKQYMAEAVVVVYQDAAGLVEEQGSSHPGNTGSVKKIKSNSEE